MPLPRLFVYGTLLSGFTNPYARLLHGNGRLLGRGRVRGTLYNLGRYPAMLLRGAGWVKGELYMLPPALLDALDEYEGSEYRRVAAAVVVESGRQARAWIYEHRDRLAGWRRIPSGDYRSRNREA